MEGEVELSLGCLKLVLNSRERDDLEFPLVLQVLDSSTIRYKNKPSGPLVSGQIISVSDGFYKRTDCFVVTPEFVGSPESRIPTFSLILIKNIDFHIKYERDRDRVPILGQILEYQILVNGNSIGLFSGTPISLDQFKTGSVEMRNPLAAKLWAQVKEGKCCDVTFRFPSLPGEPTVNAQMNALVAQSDVFEALFQSAFLEKTGVVEILDSEPKYIKSLIQFVFTQFIPLLSLKQAFEVLYLANKYLIKDLDKFCRNFIIDNKAKKTLPKDVFKYMELNRKCCDDKIHDFIIQEFANHTNILIRQPKFLTLSLENVEMFFSLLNINAQDWELLHALRRWAVANEKIPDCSFNHDSDQCLHQLLECIRWKGLPLKEAVMVNCWPEFSLHKDREFLSRISESQNRYQLEVDSVLHNSLNRSYCLNRRHRSRCNFVIYTNLILDLVREKVECLHGNPVGEDTKVVTGCSAVGPPFELQGLTIIPSYGLAVGPKGEDNIKLTIDLCAADGIEKRSSWDSGYLIMETCVEIKVFSFKDNVPTKEIEHVLKFNDGRLAHCSLSLKIKRADLQHYQYSFQDRKQLDLQMRFYNPDYTRKHRDVIESSPMAKVRRKPGPPTKPSSNYSSGVGNVLRFLRGGDTEERDNEDESRHQQYRARSYEDVIHVEVEQHEDDDLYEQSAFSDDEDDRWQSPNTYYQNRGYSPDPRSPPGRYNYTARYSLLSPLLGNSHEYSRQSHYSPSPHTSPHYRTRSENISPLYDPRIENIFPLYRPRSEKRYNRSHLSYNEVLPNGSRRDFERYIQKYPGGRTGCNDQGESDSSDYDYYDDGEGYYFNYHRPHPYDPNPGLTYGVPESIARSDDSASRNNYVARDSRLNAVDSDTSEHSVTRDNSAARDHSAARDDSSARDDSVSRYCSVKRDISVTRDISSSREREMLTQGFNESSKDSLGSDGRSRYDRFKFRNERPATDREKSNEDQKSRSRSNSKSSCERPSPDRKKSRKHQRSTSRPISSCSSKSSLKNRRKRRKSRSGFSVSTGSPLSSYAPGYRTCSSEGSPQPGPSGYQKKSGADKGYGTSTATQPIEDSDDYLSGSHSAHKLKKSSKLSSGKKRKSGTKNVWSEEKGRYTTTATQFPVDSDDSLPGSPKLSSGKKRKSGTKKVWSEEKGRYTTTATQRTVDSDDSLPGSPKLSSGKKRKSGTKKVWSEEKGRYTTTATQPTVDSDDSLSGSPKLSSGKKRKSGTKKVWSEEKGRYTTTATQPTVDSDDSQSGSPKFSSGKKKKSRTKKVLSDKKGCNISTKNPAIKLQVSPQRIPGSEYFPYSPDNKSFSPDYSPSPVGSSSPSPGPHDDYTFSSS